MLYGCDGKWWAMRQGAPDFHGLKLTADGAQAAAIRDLHRIRVINGSAKILTDAPGVVGAGSDSDTGGGNSGFQALNLAVQFGARKIVLVGFDMRLDRGSHWHGKHPPGLNNPSDSNLVIWRRVLNGAARQLAALGVEVLNASPVSTLTAFPIVTFEEALAC